ncbi:hypothetical protein [Caballeronia sp. BR00000012568055]|uniref:phage head spike fiber domain-containing protein n=1 Tax=Caballeronia sp. BR00000012568055 TaxID=2918761 RepID=UPI0023F6D7B3|nr:hypothetical protein [Caballeronia sp. BR00000012568055]
MQQVGIDVARFEHDPANGAARGLFMESARTNVITDSDAPEKWAPYGIRVSTDATRASDGKTLARKITEDTSSGVHALSQPHSITATNATYSLWFRLKAAERSIAQVMLTDSGSVDNCCANFDLIACKVETTYKGIGAWRLSAASCIPMANGWAECRISGYVTNATTLRANLYAMQADQLEHKYQGDGVSGFYFGGAQMEPGLSSSYIPTTTAAVPRYSDFLSTSDLSWLNPTVGTLLIDGAFNGVLGGGMFAFSLDDGTNNGIGIYKALGTGNVNAYSSSTTGTPLGVVLADGQRFRSAITWNNAGASASASINGRAALPIVGANPVTPTELCIGSARNHQFSSNVCARSLTYWPERIADADLTALTVVT